MKRREFVGVVGGTTMMSVAGLCVDKKSDEWVDCNVTIGHWPFRSSIGQTAAVLLEEMVQHGVTQAWTASFDGIFQNDLRMSNSQLSQDCHEAGMTILRPVGSINPTLPDWQEDLIFCQQTLGMSFIRLYPSYHSYTLSDECFGKLLDLATARRMSLQIVVQMEDERTQPLRMQVPPVNLEPLVNSIKRLPKASIMILNATRSQLEPVLHSNQVLFDIAKLEGVGVIEDILAEISHERMVFGSHAPIFYWEAARLKLRESELLDRQLNAIIQGNAVKWSN